MHFKNLKELRIKKGKSQAEMAKELNINRATLAGYEIGTNEPNIDKLKLFADYFNVSVDELIYNNSKKRTIKSSDDFRVLTISVDKENRENIEFVPNKVKAGYLEGHKDPEFIKQLPKFNLPKLPTGTFRAFEVSGDSMPPFSDGFIVIGKYLEKWQDVMDNKCYIIVTKNEGIVFKRIKNKIPQNNTITLFSDNPNYLPFTVKTEDIIEVWNFYAFIGFPERIDSNVVENILTKLELIDTKINKLLVS